MLIDPFNLSGKVAMVTGAGQGLGYEMALALANAGADVVIAEVNDETGEKAAGDVEDLGREALFLHMDVTDAASVNAAVDAVIERFDTIDVLVNNAGIVQWDRAEDAKLEDWHRVMNVNLNGVFITSQAVGSEMLERGGGSIINIASMSGSIVNVPQCQASYNASKAAVVHLTKSLAVEWAPRGVRVNSISPGYMATPMAQPFFADPKFGGVWMDRIPLGRPGRPEELGPAVVYLASNASSYMTGADLIIDGGYTCL
ncbi:MAG: glucose 1-dehydrogenase [Planctomycetaceae bacterium]|nr:SDR family oxidoreductase [Planctomycetaceae bacterium]